MKLMHLALVGLGLYLLSKPASATAGVQPSTGSTSTPAVIQPTTVPAPAFKTPLEGYTFYHKQLQALSTWAQNSRRAANGDINAQIRLIENNAMRDTAGQAFVNPVTGMRDASISDYLQSLYNAAASNSDLISTYYKQQQSYLYNQQEYYRRLK